MAKDCFKNYYFSNSQIALNFSVIIPDLVPKVGGVDVIITNDRPFVPFLYIDSSTGLYDALTSWVADGPAIIRAMFDDYLLASNNYTNGITVGPQFVDGNEDAYGTYLNKFVNGVPNSLLRYNATKNMLAAIVADGFGPAATQQLLQDAAQTAGNQIDKRYFLSPGFVIFPDGTNFCELWKTFVTANPGPDPTSVPSIGCIEIHSIG